MGGHPNPRVAAVIGDPARHSRSPAIHNAAFAATGIDWVFTAFEVPAGGGAAALEAMRVLRLGGTVGHHAPQGRGGRGRRRP